MRISDILKAIINHFNLSVEFEDFYQERNKVFLDLVRKELRPMPGLVRSLNFFKENKFKIALASSGTKEYIETVLDKFKLREYFTVIVSGDEVKRGKPDPETFLLGIKKLKVKPNETVILEDATVGIEAAKKAKAFCIAVKNPYTPKQDLSKADIVIDSLDTILVLNRLIT
jgi:HAD superfamily hydrolase (TIGR01509 family)